MKAKYTVSDYPARTFAGEVEITPLDIAELIKCKIAKKHGVSEKTVTAAILVKQWKDQKHPHFPPPKFQIGDIVKLTDNDDPDELAVVVGIRLRYYSHMRQHVYYYEIGDRQGSPTVKTHWLDADDLEGAEAKTDNQKWHVTGIETPNRSVCECWKCGQVRIDDTLDCPYCSADSLPF